MRMLIIELSIVLLVHSNVGIAQEHVGCGAHYSKNGRTVLLAHSYVRMHPEHDEKRNHTHAHRALPMRAWGKIPHASFQGSELAVLHPGHGKRADVALVVVLSYAGAI